MMKKKLFISISVFLILSLSVIMLQAAKKRPEIIIFKSSRGDVVLTHVKHTEEIGVKCIACHHRYVKAEPAACSLCHPLTETSATLKFSRVIRKDAIHKRCINCHTVTTTYRHVMPPIECDGCHIQKQDTIQKK